ncbi:MAG: MTH1187 family thiamine-binding protein [Actinomycetota bacterium]|nr:MTH1187 family thiamine-binding protein [Actinomycetota bacterium]
MLAAFSVTPLGAGDSVGDLVAEAVRIVRDSGLPSETNAMFTNLEGDWDEVMAVIHRCVEAVAARAPRVSVVIKIDHRPGVDDALHKKVEKIERELGQD